jgi:hypothetical protein
MLRMIYVAARVGKQLVWTMVVLMLLKSSFLFRFDELASYIESN